MRQAHASQVLSALLLLQDYISLKVMHASLAATSGVLSPGPKRGTPIKQLGAAPSAMAMQLSSSSSKQAAGGKAEEQHAEQAVLNQLKEVPVKAVNALLLVEPLLDHGKLVMEL